MALILDETTPSLDSVEFKKFVTDLNQSEFFDYSEDDYHLSNGYVRVGAPIRIPAPPSSISYFGSSEHEYAIIDKNTNAKVSTLKTIVPVEYRLKVYAYTACLIRDDIPEARHSEIYQIFEQFDHSSDTGGNDYIRNEAENIGIDPEAIQVSAILKYKRPDPVNEGPDHIVNQQHVDAIEASLISSFAKTRDELEIGGRGLGLKLLKKTNLPTLEDPDSIIDKDREVEATSDEDADLKKATQQLITKHVVLDCDELVTRQREKIGTLVKYPEFKVVWRIKKIKIGCVIIKTKVPQLQQRTSSKNLYVIVLSGMDVPGAVFTTIEHCTKASVVIATAVGLYTWNLKAALAAFEIVFNGCIKANEGQFYRCLIPDLVIRSDRSPWRNI